MAGRSKTSTGGANLKFARRARAPALRHDVPRTYGGAPRRSPHMQKGSAAPLPPPGGEKADGCLSPFVWEGRFPLAPLVPRERTPRDRTLQF